MLNAESLPPERRRARPRGSRSILAISCLAAVLALGLVAGASAETWRGLTVALEHRCAPYDKRRDYPYPQSVERDIVRELGAMYGPYTGRCFTSTTQTDIEHIVAASEAHDSGLCAADAATKARFARDLRNLTLASPRVNRHEKSGKDAADWVPARNRCWFADGCSRSAWPTTSPSIGAKRQRSIASSLGARARRLSPSSALRRLPHRVPPAGSPVTMRLGAMTTIETTRLRARRPACMECSGARSHPAYRFMRDGDGDGIVCE